MTRESLHRMVLYHAVKCSEYFPIKLGKLLSCCHFISLTRLLSLLAIIIALDCTLDIFTIYLRASVRYSIVDREDVGCVCGWGSS